MEHSKLAKYSYTVDYAFEKYSDMVFSLSYSRLNKSYSDAQDVTMEVFLRLLRYKPVIKSEENLKAWLIRVAINCSLTQIKSNSRHSHNELNDNSAQETKSAELIEISDERAKTVYNAVILLPEKIRTAIHLFYYEELSIQEIAKAMNTNINTVKSWLSRGRERLKKMLGENI